MKKDTGTSVNHSPDIHYTFSTKRGILFISEKVRDILGFEPSELKKNPETWKKSIHSEDRPHVAAARKGYLEGKDYSVEYRIKSKSGSWIWIHDQYNYKREENGDIIVEGQAADITLRKQAEKIQFESEQQLNFLFSQSLDGFFFMELEKPLTLNKPSTMTSLLTISLSINI